MDSVLYATDRQKLIFKFLFAADKILPNKFGVLPIIRSVGATHTSGSREGIVTNDTGQEYCIGKHVEGAAPGDALRTQLPDIRDYLSFSPEPCLCMFIKANKFQGYISGKPYFQ